MLITDFFVLKDFDELIKKFPSRKTSHRYILLRDLRRYYTKDDDLNSMKSIPNREFIVKIWGEDISSKELKKYSKSFSALKSGVNRILKNMHKKGTNPKGIRIVRGNRFGIIEAAKEDIIEQLSIKMSALKMYLSKVETKIERQDGGLSPEEQKGKGDLYKDQGIEKTIKDIEDIVNRAQGGKGIGGGEKDTRGFGQGGEQEKGDSGNLREQEGSEDILAKSKKSREDEQSVKPRDVEAAYLDARGDEMADRDVFLDVSVEEEDVDLKKKEQEKDKEADADKEAEAGKEDDDVKIPEVTEEEIKDEKECRQIEDIRKELVEIRELKEDLDRREQNLRKQLEELREKERDLEHREEEIGQKEQELKKLREQSESAQDREKLKELEDQLEDLKKQKEKLDGEKQKLRQRAENLKKELGELKKQLEDIRKQEKYGESAYEEEAKKEHQDEEKEISTKDESEEEGEKLGLKGLAAGEEITFMTKAIGEDFDELKRSYAKLVKISGGTWLIGSDRADGREGPRRKIMIKDCYIGKYPAVNELFQEFVKKTGYITDAEKTGYGWVLTQSRWYDMVETVRKGGYYFKRGGYKKVKKASWRHPFGPDSGIVDKMNHPVVQVSYRDALAFSQWVGGTLPTEFQWEYIAKAGENDKIYTWGNEFDTEQCNSIETKKLDSVASDAYEQSHPWKVFDMCGNTWEWCLNWFMPDYSALSDEARDPQGPEYGVYRVLRGGCWFSPGEEVTTTWRWRGRPMTWNNIISFRVVRAESQ